MTSSDEHSASEDIVISGIATLPDEEPLPYGCALEVKVVDVSKMDAPESVLAQSEFSVGGQARFPFSISYRPNGLPETARINIRVRIFRDGTLEYTSTTAIPAPRSTNLDPVYVPLEKIAPKSAVPLENTHWVATEIAEKPIPALPNGKEIFLTFSPEENRTYGFSGCNTYTGAYERTNQHIAFQGLASTKRACIPEISEIEESYLAALNSAQEASIQGNTLKLVDTDGMVLLKFVAGTSKPE